MFFWLFLWLAGTFFWEIDNSITKNNSEKYHFLALWVITSFFGILIFSLSWIYKLFFTEIQLYLNIESIPLLFIRLALEVVQSYITILALKHCDRSTYSIIRVVTIPLLICIDLLLGQKFSQNSLLGIGIMLISFVWFNAKLKMIDFRGWKLALFTAINAAITISLFKFSVSHYHNSIEVDQFFIYSGILIFFMVYNFRKNKTCALKEIFKNRHFTYQWISTWLANLISSYAFLYLNASEATTIKRWWEMFWSMLSGVFIFSEKHLNKKLVFAFCILGWLIIMAL